MTIGNTPARLVLFAALLCVASCGNFRGLKEMPFLTPDEDAVTAILGRTQAAQHALIHGDPAAYLALYSHRDDLMVIDAAGGPPIKGWAAVEPWVKASAANFMEGDTNLELVSSRVAPGRIELVYIEHNQVLFKGDREPVYWNLRVSQVYRLEKGDWQIVLRHADPLLAARSLADAKKLANP